MTAAINVMDNSDEFTQIECHYCQGEGCIREEAYAECPYCDGTGYYDDPVYDGSRDDDDEYEPEME